MTQITDLLSGELARLAGVSTDTPRHYERVDVLPLPPRTQSGPTVCAVREPEEVRGAAVERMKFRLTLETIPGLILISEVTQRTDLLSGELARLAGVSSDTLRHYERVGVLPRAPRTQSGYRRYPPSAVERVRLIRRAMAVGFTLDELRRVFQVRDRGGAPCRKVRELAAGKLADVEARITELETLREQLRSLLQDWDTRLAGTPEGQAARLLESI